MNEKNIVILISGNGSNLQAFIDAQVNGMLGANICAVISNKAQAYGLERAKNAGIKTHVISHKDFSTRLLFDQQLATIINKYQPELVILAGFMRILSGEFVNQFCGRLINIHPSLLPKYPGLDTHKKALENQDPQHGTSVHFVTEELDGGPVIAQSQFELSSDLGLDEVVAKVQELEHYLYPQVARWFLADKLSMEDDGIYFENKKLLKPLTITN